MSSLESVHFKPYYVPFRQIPLNLTSGREANSMTSKTLEDTSAGHVTKHEIQWSDAADFRFSFFDTSFLENISNSLFLRVEDALRAEPNILK